MSKVFRIIVLVLLALFMASVGFGVYLYTTNDLLRALVNIEESKLYYFPKKELAKLDGLAVEEIELKVADSVTVYNYYFKTNPDSLQARVFIIHGALGNASLLKERIQPLLDHGFEVYAADWRGYGKSGGTPNYQNVLNDTRLAFQDFRQRAGEDSLKTIVYGLSLGGQLAVKITLDNPEQVDLLVLDGCVPSAQQMAIDLAPFMVFRELAKSRPENFNQEYMAIRDIAKIEYTPKLIIHSVNDQVVSFQHGEDLYHNAQEPKTFWETETKHGMTLKEQPEETVAKIKALLRAENKN